MSRPPLDPADRLVTIPVRVTQLQAARIERIYKLDTLPPPEHIRRAVDIYLNMVEKKMELAPMTKEDIF